MNYRSFYRSFYPSKKGLIIGVMLLALFLAACGSGTTEAPPTAEPETADTEAPTDAPVEEEPTDAPVEEPTDAPADDDTDETEISSESSLSQGIVADTLPCVATVISAEASTLSIRFREPTNDPALMVGRLRPETELRIVESSEVDGILWYRTVNPANNTPFNWIEAQYIVLGDACVSGASGDAEMTAEATEETE